MKSARLITLIILHLLFYTQHITRNTVCILALLAAAQAIVGAARDAGCSGRLLQSA